MSEKVTKKVNAKDDFPGAELATQFDFGNNLAEMVNLFGEETVYEMAVAKGIIVVQAELAKLATSKDAEGDFIYPDGVTEEAIAEHFSNYKLEYKRGRSAGKTLIQKLIDKVSEMPEGEEKEAYKAEIRAELGIG